jgi:hypothetical protein
VKALITQPLLLHRILRTKGEEESEKACLIPLSLWERGRGEGRSSHTGTREEKFYD